MPASENEDATLTLQREPVIIVHGGAGAWNDLRSAPAEQARMRDGLHAAVAAGQRLLLEGAGAFDAVEAAVRVLEDCESFNAGRGSVLNSAGEVEMDASIMCGARGLAGGVTCVRTVLHPISAARAVMERTPHVLLAGAAADRFAAVAGLETAPPEIFVAARRKGVAGARGETVGAVALDRCGHLAAATSTGGMLNKKPGRVGDSPVVGAGTWAADGRVAVSVTGSGEDILRACLAHEIDARLRLRGETLAAAVGGALELLAATHAAVGCIAVDAAGAIAMPFLSDAMPRGLARGTAPAWTGLFADG